MFADLFRFLAEISSRAKAVFPIAKDSLAELSKVLCGTIVAEQRRGPFRHD